MFVSTPFHDDDDDDDDDDDMITAPPASSLISVGTTSAAADPDAGEQPLPQPHLAQFGGYPISISVIAPRDSDQNANI